MQERYLGDVHDFVKYSFIRHVYEAMGWSGGLNWYLANPASVDHPENNDGEQRYHLASGDWVTVDPELISQLEPFQNPKSRNIYAFERAGVLPAGTLYANAPVTNDDDRAAWHDDCFASLHGADFVFLDPDNGLEVPSSTRKARPKYALFNELRDYASDFKMVTVIQFARQCDPVKRAEEVCRRIHEQTGLVVAAPVIRARTAPNLLLITYCKPEFVAEVTKMIGDYVAKSPKLELIELEETNGAEAVAMDAETVFESLKEKHRAIRGGLPEAINLRVHRALSWLQRAEQESGDMDARFIFLWIAFNASYASEDRPSGYGERSAYQDFFEKIVDCDTSGIVYETTWKRYPKAIGELLVNKYVFQPFWAYHNGAQGAENWEQRFRASIKRVEYALKDQDTTVILSILFDRLYILRNQILHGGATWNSSVNRKQLSDGAKILEALVPEFLDQMMDNPDVDWGSSFYPVVKDLV